MAARNPRRNGNNDVPITVAAKPPGKSVPANSSDPSTRIQQAIQQAKRTGTLKLANLGLSIFPDQIHLFNATTVQGDNWWEDIPLTAIDLSHNNIG